MRASFISARRSEFQKAVGSSHLKVFLSQRPAIVYPGPVGGLGGEESLEGLRLCSGAAESREAPPGSEESRQRGPCLTHCWTGTAAPSSG